MKVVLADDELQQVVRPKVCDDVVAVCNPLMDGCSCFPSPFRGYYTQVVFDMKLSVLKLIIG